MTELQREARSAAQASASPDPPLKEQAKLDQAKPATRACRSQRLSYFRIEVKSAFTMWPLRDKTLPAGVGGTKANRSTLHKPLQTATPSSLPNPTSRRRNIFGELRAQLHPLVGRDEAIINLHQSGQTVCYTCSKIPYRT